MSDDTPNAGWQSAFDLGQPDTSSLPPSGPVIGTPDLDATEWDGQGQLPDDCAVRCEQFIIEQYTGTKIDETALVLDAEARGWYDPSEGTPPEDAGKELESHGIPVQSYEHANIYDLATELAQGHRVILGVNAEELWYGQSTGAADHAVVVSGIDTSDPANPEVIVSDPGLPGWHAEDRYPLDQFLQAWKASDFFMVATQEPAPRDVPGMENFDYASGHIPEVAGIPYDQFASLHPGAFDAMLTAQGEPTQLTGEDIMNHLTPDGHPTAALSPAEIEHVAHEMYHQPDPLAAIDSLLHGLGDDLHGLESHLHDL